MLNQIQLNLIRPTHTEKTLTACNRDLLEGIALIRFKNTCLSIKRDVPNKNCAIDLLTNT